MKFIFGVILAVSVLPVYSEEALPPKVVEEVQLLSSHETVAVFDGLHFQKCRHLTSNCPDHCHHAGSVASFTIKKYLNYEKPGKYGDPEAKAFRVMVEDQLGEVTVSKGILAKIKTLKPGTVLDLSWNHNYVTNNGSSFPVRTITKLEVQTKDD